MKIAFLGHGEAGSAFRTTLKSADPRLRVVAHDIDPGALGGVVSCGLEGLGSADWVISAVSPQAALAAAGEAAPYLQEGQVYVDANGVAPATKQRAAALIEARGAAYLDMALTGRVLPHGHRTPVLVAGAISAAAPELDRLGFDWRPAGSEAEGRPGAAAAVETISALYLRGVEALAVETLLSAQAAGCLAEVQDALSGAGLDAAGAFGAATRSGARHAAEMEESAATVQALGLNGALGAQVAAVHRASAGGPEEGEIATRAAIMLRRRGRG